MPKTTFTDLAGREWDCRLTVAFWLWWGVADPALLNMAGVLYAALYRQVRERELTPEQCAVYFACPEALAAFTAALREWCYV